jgi:mono/diheme cytochrome c family protein
VKLRIGRPVFPAVLIVALAAEAEAGGPEVGGSADAGDEFLELCADCHGEDARGNGPLAKNLTKAPPDLTQISRRAGGKFDEKAVFDWILGLNMPAHHGTREMPIWGDWLMDDETSPGTAESAEKEVEQRVMALVKFLKKLQRNQ